MTATVHAFRPRADDLSTNAVCQRIRDALYRRSGIRWSVTHGRGTAYGWISIGAPERMKIATDVERVGAPQHGTHDECWIEAIAEPGRGHIGPLGRAKLAALLGLECVDSGGESIPSGGDYYREYIDRAEGRTPEVCGKPYWD